MLPTTIILGAVYASITGRFIFFRLFRDSKHMHNHTVKGWLSWGGILRMFLSSLKGSANSLVVIWAVGFVVSQVIPFFSASKPITSVSRSANPTVLAVVGAVFDAFFGFMYWAVAWFYMRASDTAHGRRVRSRHWDLVLVMLNVGLFLMALGLCFSAPAHTLVCGILASNSKLARSRVRFLALPILSKSMVDFEPCRGRYGNCLIGKTPRCVGKIEAPPERKRARAARQLPGVTYR